MQRKFNANWQFSLLDTIIRGQFAIAPMLLAGLFPQVQNILTKDSFAENSNQLNEAPISAFMEGNSSSVDYSGKVTQEPIVAVIPLKGTMLKYGTWCSYGTSEIAEMIMAAAMDPNVCAIVLTIDSGGGAINAIPPVQQAISFAKSIGKPTIAHIDCACSAALWTASFCDERYIDNDLASMMGSLGVMMSFFDVIPYYESLGYKHHNIYSNLSEDKNDVFEKALKGEYDAIKIEMLDPTALQFQNTIKTNYGSALKVETPGLLTGKTFNGTTSINIGLANGFATLHETVEIAFNRAKTNEFLKS